MDLEKKSIERIKMASELALHTYGKPIVCTYSGGKDSDVLLELFKRADVPFITHYSLTTVDAPPTVQHIKEVFKDLESNGYKCIVDYHEKIDDSGKRYRVTMWNLIVKNMMPPTRLVRYCCRALKESSTKGMMIATGIRWAESVNRRNREVYEIKGKTKKDRVGLSDERMLLTDNDDSRMFMERCQMKGETIVNPIIDWSDSDIWQFYGNECKNHNKLYEMGYDRAGCIGCPMANYNGRTKEFYDFPTYKNAYIHSFDLMLKEMKRRGVETNEGINWDTAEDVFDWWMGNPKSMGLLNLFD